MWFLQVFHRHGLITLFTRYTNRVPVKIPTTTGRSWWATRSLSSMLWFSICGSLVSWSRDTSKLGGRQIYYPLIRLLITSLPSEPSLRSHGIALRKYIAALVYFRKAFDSVPRQALFRRLRDIGISKTLLTAIMRLYESVLGRLRTAHGVSDFIRSTAGVKQGCPLSPTLFGIYIDELDSFLHEHIQGSDRCLLHQVIISILLFADDVVLLAPSPKGLQRQLDALALFCDLRQLTINLGKTKVMIFNGLKKTSDLHLFFRGEEIEITGTYTYLGVKF